MNEIIFMVEEDFEGGYNARALSESIYTQAETLKDLQSNISDAVDCHYEPESTGRVRLRSLLHEGIQSKLIEEQMNSGYFEKLRQRITKRD